MSNNQLGEESQNWEKNHLKELRESLHKARKTVEDNHGRMAGNQAAQLYAFALEELMVGHFEAISSQMGEAASGLTKGLSIIAVGGFGRREIGLYSDIDFLFITAQEPTPLQEEFIKATIRPLFDLRIDLGYGVHSVEECLAFLGNDITKATALLAMRPIWGDVNLAEELQERLQARLSKKHKLWFVRELEKEMRGRHAAHGDTVFLLEPDVKFSRGGLRDIHQMLWIAFAMYGVCSIQVLLENGVITSEEESRLGDARSFLLRVRNSLHLLSKRRIDQLSLERQLHVSKDLDFEPTEFALAEELLMRRYYDHALLVERLSLRCLRRILEQTSGTDEAIQAAQAPAIVARDFRARGGEIWIEDQDLHQLHGDRYWIMKFFLAAARYNLQPREDTLRAIESRLSIVDTSYRRSPVARDLFMNILICVGSVAKVLRAMHHCGFLSAWIPEFAMVRNLPRIDHYHQYTVDEHLIRSVAVAEKLLGETPPPGTEHVAEVAKEVLRIDLLMLSLLLHDVGKGEGRGHVIRGMHIIQRIAERMRLRPIEQRYLRQLVAHHQKMVHMALRRDIEDEAVIKELAGSVKVPEELKMLYVHSACDMVAVSTESWNDWRARLLAILFERTLDQLRGLRFEKQTRIDARDYREQTFELLQASEHRDVYSRDDVDHFLFDMPVRYLRSTNAEDMMQHFLLAQQLSSEERITASVTTYEGSSYPEITFVARSAPGLFSNICGALAAKRFNIKFAQIYTASSGEAIDVFQVEIPEIMQAGVEEILHRICDRLNRMLKTGVKERWTDIIDKSSTLITQERLELNPPRVDIDNETSPDCTIIEVRAPDRPGLLSEIGGVLDQFSLNIDLAFIATESYQLVDVFYVTDLETNKITDKRRLEDIRNALMERIEARIAEVRGIN